MSLPVGRYLSTLSALTPTASNSSIDPIFLKTTTIKIKKQPPQPIASKKPKSALQRIQLRKVPVSHPESIQSKLIMSEQNSKVQRKSPKSTKVISKPLIKATTKSISQATTSPVKSPAQKYVPSIQQYVSYSIGESCHSFFFFFFSSRLFFFF